MRGVAATIAAALLAACNASPGITSLEDASGGLVKESYTVQADGDGLAEFQLPAFDAEAEGVPMVQVYEASDAKLSKLYLAQIPHTLDTLGRVYVETDPEQWIVIVVVRTRSG